MQLVEQNGVVAARVGNSKTARIAMAKDEGGITGDPWTPIVTDGKAARALSIEARGFNYRRLAAILFEDGLQSSPLQVFGPTEDGDSWSLLCRAIARGQGKTEGYHERRVRIPPRVVRRLKAGERPELGAYCKERIEQAAAVRSALRFALMTLFQNGPDAFDPRDPSSARRADPVRSWTASRPPSMLTSSSGFSRRSRRRTGMRVGSCAGHGSKISTAARATS